MIIFDAVILTFNPLRTPLQPGADIQFHRPNRLDVCLVQNHPIALYVSTFTPRSPARPTLAPPANARGLGGFSYMYMYTHIKTNHHAASSSQQPTYRPSSARATSTWASRATT